MHVAVLGASGYTGEEVVRLLALHPTFKVTTLTGNAQAGKVRAWQCRTPSQRCWGPLLPLQCSGWLAVG